MSIEEVEARLSLPFDDYVEDGLGPYSCCGVSVDGLQLIVKGPRKPADIGALVEMHSSEPNPRLILDKICALLGCGQQDLPWVSDFTTAPQWSVWRLDDNGKEVEMVRLHIREMAEFYAEKLRLQLAALDTAQNIDDMDIPGYRLHRLKGRAKGGWSIWVSGNWRLTFEFRDDNVHVLDYEDYH